MAVRVTVKYWTGTPGSRVDKQWTGSVPSATESAIIAAIKRERAYEQKANIVITDIRQG